MEQRYPQPIDRRPESDRRVDSWKEIAAFLRCGERTFGREEAERGLPVHRMPGSGRGRVFAYTAELSRWSESGLPELGALPTTSTPPSRSLRWSVIAPIVLALLASIIAAYQWTRGRDRHAPVPVLRQLTANPTEDWVMGAAISPDGKSLAFLDATGLYVRSIDSGETHPVATPAEWPIRVVTGLRWFPDGRRLIACVAVSGHYDIWAIATVGQSRPLLIHRDGSWPAISPDGQSIVFQNGDRQRRGADLWVGGMHGESPRKLAGAESGEMVLSPIWSPDGRWIAYLRGREDPMLGGQVERAAAVEIRPAGGGPAHRVVPGASLPASTSLYCMHGRGCLGWSQDGRLFFPASDRSGTELSEFGYSLWGVPVAVRNGEPAGQPVRVAQWADFYPNCLTLAADGKRLAFLKSRIQLDVYVGDLGDDGSSLGPTRRLTLDNRGLGSTPDSWTRDSRAMFFTSDRNGKEEVFRQGPNESLARPVVELPGYQSRNALLSADGSWFLYSDRVPSASGPDSSPQRLMRLPVAGGLPERVLDLPAAASFEYRCPLRTGSCVLSLQQGREMLFYTLDPVRGKGRLLGKTDRWNQRFAWDVSPDSSRLAVMGSHRQILMLADGVWHEIPIEAHWGPEYIAWTADGQGFFVTSSSTLDLLHITITGKEI